MLVIVLLATLACSSGDDSVPAAPTVAVPSSADTGTSAASTDGAPVYGGTVTVPATGSWAFDPASNVFGFSWQKLGAGGNMWNELIRISPTDRETFEGDLAESWQMSDDGLTLKVKLIDGIMDHEGDPFTIEDVYYQLFRYVERPNKTPANTQACLRTYVKKVLDESGNKLAEPGLEITGTHEISIRFTAPRASTIACLGSPSVLYTPSKYTKAIDDAGGGYRDIDPDKGEYVGTGPFKIDMNNYEVGARMVWERNPNYFKAGLPYLDSIEHVLMSDDSAILANIRAGRLDVLGPLAPNFRMSEMQQLKKDLGDKILLHPHAQYRWEGIQLNVQDPALGPVGDPNADKVRKAIRLAVDPQEYIDGLYDGEGTIMVGFNLRDTWINTLEGWYSDMPAFNPDPASRAKMVVDAKQLMVDAGYGPDNKLSLLYLCATPTQHKCEAVAGQLNRDIYVDITVALGGGYGATSEKVRKGDYQIMSTAHNGRFADPDAMTLNVYPLWPDGGRNYTNGWTNDKFWELHDKQNVEPDKTTRGGYLREMAKIVYEDAAMISIATGPNFWINRGNWRGYTPPPDPNVGYSLENVWLAP
jgi:peptide/nickel transport system substrate-binding protein